MLHQKIARWFVEPGQFLAVALGVLAQKIVRQRHDVFAPIPQRRQCNLDRVQSKKQILTETSGRHFLVQIRVRRGNDADVRVQSFRRTDALEFSRLDHAQQFRLLIHRNVRDLVHEQRAFVRQLEAPGAIRLRVGKRAFHMAEQFALEKSFPKVRPCSP